MQVPGKWRHGNSRSRKTSEDLFIPKIYAVSNRELLTCHEIPISKKESSEEEWCPVELWNGCQEVGRLSIFLVVFDIFLHVWNHRIYFKAIRCATENLVILDIEPSDIVAIGITNQRETTILWNKRSGECFNALCFADKRLNKIVDQILMKAKNKRNYLRSVCGLPVDV